MVRCYKRTREHEGRSTESSNLNKSRRVEKKKKREVTKGPEVSQHTCNRLQMREEGGKGRKRSRMAETFPQLV
jgi:hypothetical protein